MTSLRESALILVASPLGNTSDPFKYPMIMLVVPWPLSHGKSARVQFIDLGKCSLFCLGEEEPSDYEDNHIATCENECRFRTQITACRCENMWKHESDNCGGCSAPETVPSHSIFSEMRLRNLHGKDIAPFIEVSQKWVVRFGGGILTRYQR